MSTKKKQVRKEFRDTVFQRDKYSCRGCGYKSSPEKAEEELDAHHITNRNDMPNGGYVKENGVSLCKHGESPTCHEKAEQWLNEGTGEPGFSPAELYAKIGSSYERAVSKSNQL